MKKRLYVNIYRVSLAYGGPEEGGWWYDVGEFVHALPARNQRAAVRIQAALLKRFKDPGEQPRARALSTGETVAWVQDFRGADFPDRRPHYE